MAPTSAAVLVLAVAMALMAMAALQLSAAAAPARPPAPIGLPGCNTTCGNVSVPYPFGYGHSHCYWPGLNLTCDTNHHPPRLLLGDGTLRVTDIFLSNQSVRVMRNGFIINTTGDLTSDGWNTSFGRGFTEHGYALSSANDLIVFGCDVTATLLADFVGAETPKVVSGCVSLLCIKSDDGASITDCREKIGCCREQLTFSVVPRRIEARWLYSGNHTSEQTDEPVTVFVAESRWFDEQDRPYGFEEAPLLLDFGVKEGLPPQQQRRNSCTQDVHRMVCKSEHSYCHGFPQQGYFCDCKSGYEGNGYIAGGCQDVDECKFLGEEKVCFGVCINRDGSYDCQCPQGTYGDPHVVDGCVNYNFNKDVRLPLVVTPQIGLPGCNTTCGDVKVPYPFGFGQPGCCWQGFNLTCDISHGPPRLLLGGDSDGNSTLQVVHISLRNSTVRVIHHHQDRSEWFDHSMIDGNWSEDVRLRTDIGEPYVLSTRNEFIVLSGWEVRATLHGEYKNGSSSNTTDSIISQVVCIGDRAAGETPLVPTQTHRGYCSGYHGCCHAPINASSIPMRAEFKMLNKRISHAAYDSYWPRAIISEEGLTDQWNKIFNMNGTPGSISSPVVLQWAVKQGFSAPAADNLGKCPTDVVSRLCNSDNSYCRQEINGGFTCHCSEGYDGNPYVANGCQDIDECKLELSNPCLGGYCKNLPGHYECQNPRLRGLIIGLATSGPALLLLVLGIMFILRKCKQRRIKAQKQKYFKQNRGQLLQQLLSQKTDIAERMIIPLDELAKATNNFDTSREIGGGGHGTVYKGILSNLHVVAIKKSKITVQKEIDEFINEVAILSQINHKNVVKLFGCCLETEVPLLVYEFISNGTLYHHLHVEELRSLSWGTRLRIATEIATSLAYLHSSVSIPIIHRDIKSSNILLDDTMTSKISDFGASRYIPVEKTGLTTRVQGTIGYLDPMYFYTGRLTEKSDVYSFGVILVELLTRKKPFSYLSTEGDGLVSHFVNLLSEGNVFQIIDPQVMEEGGTEVQEVATLAASCINLRGEERPTMRDVEHTLHGLRSPTRCNEDGTVAMEPRNDCITTDNPSLNRQGQRYENPCSRRYSLEQEMMMSARYPR